MELMNWQVQIRNVRRIKIDEGYSTEEDYPFTIKPCFSSSNSIVDIEPGRGWQVSLVVDETLRVSFGYKPNVVHEEYILSHNFVDILSFDNFSLKLISPMA